MYHMPSLIYVSIDRDLKSWIKYYIVVDLELSNILSSDNTQHKHVCKLCVTAKLQCANRPEKQHYCVIKLPNPIKNNLRPSDLNMTKWTWHCFLGVVELPTVTKEPLADHPSPHHLWKLGALQMEDRWRWHSDGIPVRGVPERSANRNWANLPWILTGLKWVHQLEKRRMHARGTSMSVNSQSFSGGKGSFGEVKKH